MIRTGILHNSIFSEIGEVTVRIFDFNNDERIIERLALIEVNRYPSEPARQRIIKPTEE